MAEDVVRAMLVSALKELLELEDMKREVLRRKQRRDYAFKRDVEEVQAVNHMHSHFKSRYPVAIENARRALSMVDPRAQKGSVRYCEFTGDDSHFWDEVGFKKACEHISASDTCVLYKQPLIVGEDGWRQCCGPCQQPIQVKVVR